MSVQANPKVDMKRKFRYYKLPKISIFSSWLLALQDRLGEWFSYVKLLGTTKHLHIVVVVVRTAQPRDWLHLEYLMGLAADLK